MTKFEIRINDEVRMADDERGFGDCGCKDVAKCCMGYVDVSIGGGGAGVAEVSRQRPVVSSRHGPPLSCEIGPVWTRGSRSEAYAGASGCKYVLGRDLFG